MKNHLKAAAIAVLFVIGASEPSQPPRRLINKTPDEIRQRSSNNEPPRSQAGR